MMSLTVEVGTSRNIFLTQTLSCFGMWYPKLAIIAAEGDASTVTMNVGFKPDGGPYEESMFGDNDCDHINWLGHMEVGARIDDPRYKTYVAETYFGTFESVPSFNDGEFLVLTEGSSYSYQNKMDGHRATFRCVSVETDTAYRALAYCYRGATMTDWVRWGGIVWDPLHPEWNVAFSNFFAGENEGEDSPPDDLVSLLRSWDQDWPDPSGVTLTSVNSVPNLKWLDPNWRARTLRLLAERIVDSIQLDESLIEVRGQLAERATRECRRVNANTLATAKEVLLLPWEVNDLIQALLGLARVTRNPGRLIQAIGNLRLSLKWGLPLTVRDGQEISTAIMSKMDEEYNKLPYHFCRSGRYVNCHGRAAIANCDVKYRTYVKVYYNLVDSREAELARPLFDINLLSFTNAWDLIPYSFVVDWFVNVEAKLRVLDDLLYRESFQTMLGSVISDRYEVKLTPDAMKSLLNDDVAGEVSLKYYRRRCHWDYVPLPIFPTASSSLGFTQFFDGATLIIQRM